jgi:hypothetical protein
VVWFGASRRMRYVTDVTTFDREQTACGAREGLFSSSSGSQAGMEGQCVRARLLLPCTGTGCGERACMHMLERRSSDADATPAWLPCCAGVLVVRACPHVLIEWAACSGAIPRRLQHRVRSRVSRVREHVHLRRRATRTDDGALPIPRSGLCVSICLCASLWRMSCTQGA